MKAEPQRRGDIPVPPAAKVGGWKTPAPVIEAEARETDKALREILKTIGV
jgi:hypothetical protein